MEDLSGSAGERAAQFALIASSEHETEWLARQLTLVLVAWGDDEARLAIQAEGREDF